MSERVDLDALAGMAWLLRNLGKPDIATAIDSVVIEVRGYRIKEHDQERRLESLANCVIGIGDKLEAVRELVRKAAGGPGPGIISRLLLYVTLHRQANPEWNGNRFDDEKAAHEWLANCRELGLGEEAKRGPS